MGAPVDSIAGIPRLIGSRAMVVLFGDSLTQRGYQQCGWVSAVSNYYGRKADVFNRGYGGYNTKYGRHLMRSLFPISSLAMYTHTTTGKYLLATVWFGTNDAVHSNRPAHVPLEEYKANMEYMVSYLQDFFYFVVVISPPPVHETTRLQYQKIKYGEKATNQIDLTNEKVREYATIAKQVAHKYNVLFLDIFNLMIEQGETIWPSFVGAGIPGGDGVHFSSKGEEFVGSHVLDLLEKKTVPIESLPAELPWGSSVNGENYISKFEEHQLFSQQHKLGLGLDFACQNRIGLNWIGSASYQLLSIGVLSLLVLIAVMFRCFVKKSLHRPARTKS